MPHRIYVEDGKLIVEFEGFEAVEALKRRLEFSLSNIVSVSTEPHRWLEGLRVGGTGLPGVIKEGRYIVNGKAVFFAMKHPEKCITIELKNERYDAVVVEVEDKEALKQELSRYLKS